MVELFQNPVMVLAFLAGIAASVIGGTIGTFVVVRRISFISGSISHSVMAGIGLAIWLERSYGLNWLSPIMGALLAAVASALLIARAERSFQEREDSIIATVWAAGMALGIVFIAKTPGYTSDLSSVLIGNILWITPSDVALLAILALISLLFAALSFQKLKLLAFDPDEAKIQGINVDRLYSILLVLVGISVVALTQVVGIVLVLTMLTLPQLCAGLYSRRLSSMMVGSVIISIFCTTGGLAAAWVLDWPAGASIALTSVAVYIAGLAVARIGKRGIRTLGTLTGTRP